jgi:hypothetical protein
MIGSEPWRANKAADGTIGEWRLIGKRVFKRLEGCTNIVAQRFKPGSRACLPGFQLSSVHRRLPVASYLI